MKEIKVQNCRWVQLQRYNDGVDGHLTIGEARVNVPFAIRRIFSINELNNKQALRGMHAHRKLQQAIFSLRGSFELELYDGRRRASVTLDRPELGVYMGPGVWHVMSKFRKGTVILVLASARYDEKDYLRDFREFKKFAKAHLKRPPRKPR